MADTDTGAIVSRDTFLKFYSLTAAVDFVYAGYLIKNTSPQDGTDLILYASAFGLALLCVAGWYRHYINQPHWLGDVGALMQAAFALLAHATLNQLVMARYIGDAPALWPHLILLPMVFAMALGVIIMKRVFVGK